MNYAVCDPSKPLFASQPCGANKLSAMVKEIFVQVGITSKMNHSLRATGVSEMFRSGVPEKLVQERTGHRTMKALCTYENTSTSQYMAISNVQESLNEVEYSEVKSNPPSKFQTNGTTLLSCGRTGFTSLFGMTSC